MSKTTFAPGTPPPLATALAIAVLIAAPRWTLSADTPQQIEFFEQRIRPMLVEHCFECHGPDEPSGKLRLDVKDGWVRGASEGRPLSRETPRPAC